MTSPARVLILGGTSEAGAFAAALATRTDVASILSLAGRTENPRPAPIPVRVGGFGGVDGMVAYLGDNSVAAVVDATHPFAERISANAVIACAIAQTPLLVLTRPPWPRRAGDDWIEVETVEAAVDALGGAPRRVFLTHGRLRLGAFARAPQHHYLVRSIDPPADIDRLPNARLILARGPFTLADEERLMGQDNIEALVTKNSGGEATYPKIEAARALGVSVVMIKRPTAPDVETAYDLEAALAWIEAHRAAP
jgi:precorrin-6A/cobalt-precorrin-6A reductase